MELEETRYYSLACGNVDLKSVIEFFFFSSFGEAQGVPNGRHKKISSKDLARRDGADLERLAIVANKLLRELAIEEERSEAAQVIVVIITTNSYLPLSSPLFTLARKCMPRQA